MNDLDHMRTEIAENERWLAAVCERSSVMDTARVKNAVGLAAQEAWLARHDDITISPALSSRIKARVRVELARTGPHRRRWSVWLLGATSAAAMVTLGVLSFEQAKPVRTTDASGISLVAGFGALDDIDAGFDAELSALQAAVGSLDGLGSGDDGDDDWTSDWSSGFDDAGSGT